MRVLKKAIAGLLLIIGLPIVVLASLDILNPESSQEEKGNATAALIVLGIPPAAIGAWLAGGLHNDARRQERDRLRTTFFNLVKHGQGRISVFEFSEATELSGDRARLYLDDRARTFNATFHVDDAGGMFYVFNLGYTDSQRLIDNATPHPLENRQTQAFPHSPEADSEVSNSEVGNSETDSSEKPSESVLGDRLKQPTHLSQRPSEAVPDQRSEQPTYDIVLKHVAGDRQTDLQQLIQTLTPHDAETAARLLKEPLSVIARGLSRATAEQYRRQLEAAGAAVLVVLPPPETLTLDSPLQDAPAEAQTLAPEADATPPIDSSQH